MCGYVYNISGMSRYMKKCYNSQNLLSRVDHLIQTRGPGNVTLHKKIGTNQIIDFAFLAKSSRV